MDLKIFKIKNNLDNKKLAELLGITKDYLSSIMSGNFKPSSVLTKRIIVLTKGEIDINKFYFKELAEAKHQPTGETK